MNFIVETRAIGDHVDSWTGRKDKNGKKIYEHDFVRIHDCDNPVALVTYDDWECRFDMYIEEENEYICFGEYGDGYYEVIGNLYEGINSPCPYAVGDYVYDDKNLMIVKEVYGTQVDLESARTGVIKKAVNYNQLTMPIRESSLRGATEYLVGKSYKLKDGKQLGIISAVDIEKNSVLIGDKWYCSDILHTIIDTIDGKPYVSFLYPIDNITYYTHDSVLWMTPADVEAVVTKQRLRFYYGDYRPISTLVK